MKTILRLFGLIRVKDIVRYCDNESEFWGKRRDSLTDVGDILYENKSNHFSHYKHAYDQMRRDIMWNEMDTK